MMIRAALLISAMVLISCENNEDARSPRLQHRVILGANPKKAPHAMRKYGCSSCHTIDGVPGAHALVGPELNGIRDRNVIAGRFPNEPDVLVRWIQDPQGMKPITAMPNMGVSDEDARNIAAYLYDLKR
jgi:cytochrome c